MLEGFLLGVTAGYAVAIPVGPIALLIVRTGLDRGLRPAAAAGAGAASADLIYATIAIVLGGAAVRLVTPLPLLVRVVAAAALALVALRVMTSSPHGANSVATGRSTYFTFLALTVANPLTIVTFAAVAIGLPDLSSDAGVRVAFVLGAFLASLSWQLLLAGVGGLLHGRLPERARRVTSFVGGAIVLALAARVLLA